jgi:hypothetical protein
MRYTRPKSTASPLARADRRALLEDYFAHYSGLAKQTPAALNQKVPRKVFAVMLDAVGELLLRESADLAKKPGAARDFLELNPLPPGFADKLPDEFRIFCLALNALKQWVAAEQAATDRYLLGGTARTECRAVASTCVLSGEILTATNTDLHHPVRDGRPPIPLSKKAHAEIEGQASAVKGAGSGAVHGSTALVKDGTLTYRSSRLAFRAKFIEPLGDTEKFRIETPKGIYEMTKADFFRTFANVAASDSYRVNGVYHYSTIPAKALAYRISAAGDQKKVAC